MRRSYQHAEKILSWIGPDTQDHQAVAAIKAITEISNLLCQKLGVSVSDLRSISNIYQKLVLKNRVYLPLQVNANSVPTQLGSL